MNKRSKKFLTWSLVICMVLTQMLFTNVAFASSRYSGANRYATALEIVKNGWTKSDVAVIARGDDDGLADALAAAPLAYAKGQGPILLTEPGSLYAGIMDELKALEVKTVYIVGGPNAIKADVEDALKAQFGAENVKRVYGDNRFDTSAAIAKEIPSYTSVALVNGYAYADALSVSSIAANAGMPILLTSKDSIPESIKPYIDGKTVYAVGGSSVISDGIVSAVSATRLSGLNRYETNASVLGKFTLDYSKVYLAKGADENAADALAGSALAAKTNSPIVLVDGTSVASANNVLKAGLKADSEVILLGGTSVLTQSVADAVEALRPQVQVPAELKIDSVSALNLRQMAVKFNKALDEDTATDINNYELDTDGNADLDGARIQLLDDNKTVLITFAAGKTAEQQEKVELTVTDVEDADGNVIEKSTVKDIEFVDTKLPVALDAKVIGNDTIKVTFDEPVTADKNSFEINGGDINIKGVTMVNNDTEANIQLYSTLENGTIDVKVLAKAKDFAGFTVVAKTFTVNVVEDEDAPVVVGYKDAKPSQITLIFDEEIAIEDGSVANFYHTNTKNTVDSAVTSADLDGKELTLHFTNNNLPSGTAYVYIEKGSVRDLWDNENEDITAKVEITVDTTKPELKKIEAKTEKQIELTFSEDVKDVEKSDFTVVDSDNEAVSVKRATANGDTVILEFADNLSGEYTLTVKDIEDEAGNVIDEVSKEFTVDDMTAPVFGKFTATLYNASAEDQMLKINFGEKMATDGKYSVNDIDKYTVGSYVLSKLDCDVTIKVVNDGKAVEITIPSKADDSKNGVDLTAAMDIAMARVADAAGNYTADLSGIVDIDPAGTVAIEKVEATDVDTLKVTFGSELTSFDVNDLIVYVGTTDSSIAVAKVKTSLNDDGNTVATLTLASDIDFDAANVKVDTVESPKSKNAYNETLAGKATKAVTDKIVPALAEDNDGNELVYAYDTNKNGKVDTVVVEYTEALDKDTVAKNTYKVTDITVLSAIVSDAAAPELAAVDTTAANGKYVVIKLDETDTDLPVDGSYQPEVTQVLPISDAHDNELQASADVLTAFDMAAPAIIGAEIVNATTIKVTLSEDIAKNKSTAVGNWTVTGSTVTAVSINNNVVTLTVDNTSGASSVSYTTEAGKNQDAAGNDLATDSYTIE